MPATIHIMTDTLASQVAAGEVVERPASVIKELVENSLDAGAKHVRVDIQRGGISLIRITDDGCGMSPEDAQLCIQRHATSKLLDVGDLFQITQLGFRGEALPSIASISRLNISTRTHDALEGVEIRIDGGNAQEPRSSGCAPGTCIEMRDLFFNTPVRRKFLKSEDTEASHIEHQLRLHALAFPQVRFTFRKDQQLVFDTPATHELRQRIASLTSPDTADQLIPITTTYGPGITVSGFLLPLTHARRNRQQQFIFLNRRPIDDPTVARALRDGYGGLPTGLHPALYLLIDMEPALVDVNVHPSKREVRFRRPSDLINTVMEAISTTLRDQTRSAVPVQETNSSSVQTTQPVLSQIPNDLSPSLDPVKKTTVEPKEETTRPITKETTPAVTLPNIRPLPAHQRTLPLPAPPTRVSIPAFRHIGTLHNRYALFENDEGLVILSPRAARERILFEQLLASQNAPLSSQKLLSPILLDLDPRDFQTISQLNAFFSQAGFSLTPFGTRTIRIEAIPALLKLKDIESFLRQLIDSMAHADLRKKLKQSPFEPFAHTLSQRYAQAEALEPLLSSAPALLAQLLSCEIPYCTPTGKPTLSPISLHELKRKFSL